MKTATFKLNFQSLFFVALFAAVGCQKDEFAPKEYLDNPFAPPEVIDPSTTGGSTGGDSTTGGSTGGSTTGGTTTGGTTTGGTTTGGTTTGGTTTGGTTTGGTTTGGTTTGGSTTGGTTTGGSTTGASNPQWMDESFTQSSTGTSKLDILWVIDDSGSMSDEQNSLGTNFDLFINDFIDKGVDFQMGITTTDVTGTKGGKAVTGSQTKLTSAMAAANRNQFLSDFENLVKVGISGSGNEKGLQASEMYVNRYKDSWMRSDAYFVVVYVSDEEDQSPNAPADYLSFLQSTKPSAGFMKAYSIVGMTGCPIQSGYTCGYARYDYVSQNSGGSTANITGNFASILSDIGQEIITLLDTFPLAHDVIPGTMEVKFDGVDQATGWVVEGRQLKIDAGTVPPVGTSITVRYQY